MTREEIADAIQRELLAAFNYGRGIGRHYNNLHSADRILDLMPDPALAEIGRLAVAADKAPSIVTWGDAVRAEVALHAAIAAYLTSDHPPRHEPDPGAGMGD